jgi:hypothetical protein
MSARARKKRLEAVFKLKILPANHTRADEKKQNYFGKFAAKQNSSNCAGARAARPQARSRAKKVEREINLEFNLNAIFRAHALMRASRPRSGTGR